jgi:hypothetical protein
MRRHAHIFFGVSLNAKELISIFDVTRFRFESEDDLKAGVAGIMTKIEIEFEREKVLCTKDRPDFFVTGGTVIELKIKGPLAQVER